MAHQENWVRRFIVSEPKKHWKGFTLYKVTSVEFPKGSPEAGSTIVVWKRYNDFKKLHQELKLKHQQLYLKGTFPHFAKAKMFGRFDEAVIEERRKCALALLEFIGDQGPLFNSDVCSKFLSTGYIVSEDDNSTPTIPSHPIADVYFPDAIGLLLPQPATLAESTSSETQPDTETNSLLGGTWQFPRVPDSISLSSVSSDEQTTFTDTDSSALSGVSTPLQNADLQFFDPLQQSPSKKPASSGGSSSGNVLTDFTSNSWLLSTTTSTEHHHTADQPHLASPKEVTSSSSFLQKDNENSSDALHVPSTSEKPTSKNNKIVKGCTELPAKTFITVRTEDFETSSLSKFHQASEAEEAPEASASRPFSPSDLDNESLNQNVNYIFEAAYHVGQAQLHEANGEFEAAFSFFKAGIACLLCGIQDETDIRRKNVVSKKISKYLLHAEKLYNCHLGSQSTYHSRSAVPQLCRPLSELKCYRVLGIIDKQMLVLNSMDDTCYVIKVLHKSSCPINGQLKTIMPQNVPYMVAMHRYFETDSAAFLVLQHASGGRLWKHIGSYFQSVPNTPVRTLKQGNAYLGRKLIQDSRNEMISSVLTKSTTNGFLKASSNANGVTSSGGISNRETETYLDLIRDYTDSKITKSTNLVTDIQNMSYLQCKHSSEKLVASIIPSNELYNGGKSKCDIPVAAIVDNICPPISPSERWVEDKTDAHFNQNNNPTPDILSQTTNFIHDDSWQILNNLPTDDLVKNAQRLLESVSETLIQSESIANRLDDDNLTFEDISIQEGGAFSNFLSTNDVPPDIHSRGDYNFQFEIKKEEDQDSKAFQCYDETFATEADCGGGDANSRRKKERKLSSRSQRSAKSSERRMYSSDDLLGCARAPSGSLDREQQWSRLHLEDDCVKPRLPERTVQGWAAELLVCLDGLHRWGVCCKDLRPDNILLGDQGHLLVTYMCQWESVDSLPNPNAIRRLYAAPEVNGIFPVSQAADWWSFGALVFELITGKSLLSCHPSGIHNHTFINIPEDVSENAKSLLEELLKANPSERLGSGVNGAEDVKSHPFFHGVDWHAVLDLGTNHLEEL